MSGMNCRLRQEALPDDDPDKPQLGEPIHPEMDLIPANETDHTMMLFGW